MPNCENFLGTPVPWNIVAEGYKKSAMPMLAFYSEEALKRVSLSKESRILDVACGPGTLSLMAAERVKEVQSIDFSENMVTLFNRRLEEEGIRNASVRLGDGQNLPFEDNFFDAAFSMFGLIFFPDRGKGFAEIFRTLKPGGQIAVSSWGPMENSPVMQALSGALKEMDPDLLPPGKDFASLEDPKIFSRELENAGFSQINVTLVTRIVPIESVELFWEKMKEASVPVLMLRKKMGEALWAEKESAAVDYLKKVIPKRPTELPSQAWLGIGRK